MFDKEPFSKLDFGTKPTSAKLVNVAVSIDPAIMIDDFAVAYKNELHRRNPERDEAVGVTSDELKTYFHGLLAIRVESIGGNCPVWRQAKQLLIPSWIEFTLSQVGQVIDTDRGLRIYPVYEEEYDINTLLDISNKLRMFTPDGLVLHKDAMPRNDEGDPDTMMMAIIEGYVYSQTKDAHPITSYVASFLGFKLQEEAAFKMLYRVRYDDIAFIKAMLLREESVF